MSFPNFDRYFNQANSSQSLDAYDNTFKIVDRTDPTKQVEFDVSSLTTNTRRTITLPDYDVNFARRNILSGEASLVLTPAMSGSLILIDDATQAFVLPALTATEVGIVYEFCSTVAATTTTITAGAADLLVGGLAIVTASVPAADHFQPDGSDDLVITMNGTTQGGMVGSRLRLEAISATRWLVSGTLLGTSTVITPFS